MDDWTREDQEEALADGWGLFAHDGNQRKVYIQRYDEADMFRDDVEALEHVKRQARDYGDELCVKALMNDHIYADFVFCRCGNFLPDDRLCPNCD